MKRLLPFILPSIAFLLIIATAYFFFNDFFHKFDDVYNRHYFFNEGFRWWIIRDAMCGWQETGSPLVRCSYFTDPNGAEFKLYYPIESSGDDVGIYFFVPLIARLFSIEYMFAYKLLFSSLVFGGFVLSSVGFALLFRNFWTRFIANLLLGAFAFFCFYVFDVYVLAFTVISTVPITLWIWKKKKLKPLLIAAFLLGLLVGIANLFRDHSGTGLLLFLLIGLLFSGKQYLSLKPKVTLVGLLLLSFVIPKTGFYLLAKKRDAVLENHYGRKPEFGNFVNSHIFWHNVYLGLGYIENNKYGIEWSDMQALDRANRYMKNQPETSSPLFTLTYIPEEYESILKNEIFSILRKNPFFIMKTVTLKFFDILWKLLICFNVGLVLLFLVKPPLKQWIPFAAGIAFYSLPALLVWPFPMYVLGALSLILIACLLLLGNYLNKFLPQAKQPWQ
ncbi:MAG: hypothetical protein COA57_04170 [Flavobacteriales bacterium]|nr:MAG: hypothetical protein COA57_04170 [Flavobacteriales bacterium]